MPYKYNVFRFDLTSGLRETLNIPGGFVYVKEATDGATNVNIHPDTWANDAINLKVQFGMVVNFSRLHISALPQVGRSITLIITSSYDEFRIFEQAQLQNINTLGTVTNPVAIHERALEDVTPHSTVTVGTTQTSLAPADATGRRRSVLILNNSANNVWIGGTGVTTANGMTLLPNASIELESQSQIFGIATVNSDCRVRIERVII